MALVTTDRRVSIGRRGMFNLYYGRRENRGIRRTTGTISILIGGLDSDQIITNTMYSEKEVKEIMTEVAETVREPLQREILELRLHLLAKEYGWKDIKWLNKY